ncbi:methyltransferase domain-containing protein [Streptomyces sp. t39]|uniref:methyltransferase domain-containing protein n=1 Tax=Streptomyces sp. t39 TaxID=1828156 RepID=UPI0011CDB70D|nr:methyltransferase domain-containing protein [Streptomyces sp. t39]TXS48819.1 methyltransferase domain-containing protein [Streptomyces sp. t39]
MDNHFAGTTGDLTPPPALLTVLDTLDRLPEAVRLRERGYGLLAAARGARVVDAGCGGGLAVAELIARGVAAEGADLDTDMVATARARVPAGTFHVADVRRLPYEDGEVDGYRADKLLHSLPEPAAALAEARRVLAPGGRAVLVGQDWDTAVVDCDDGCLARAVVAARADLLPSPRAARAHRALLLDAGFTDVVAEVHTAVLTAPALVPLATGLAGAALAAGAIGEADAERWTAEQHRRAAADRFFMAVPFFLTAGTRR